MSAFTFVGTFNVHTCPVVGCGVKYALDADYENRKSDDAGRWYCPNGHTLVHITPEVTRLRNELECAQNAAIDARKRAESERRSHAATKGILTKTRRRIHNGVCPNCHRHFENVERHMASKHPEGE